MVNQEILEGIKNAMSRGESLRNAMMTFYNSGYPKWEIEEAARIIQSQRMSVQQRPGYSQQIQTSSTQPIQPIQQQRVQQGNVQRVSNYGKQINPPSPGMSKEKIFIFILIFILLLLIGVLIGVFIFKENIIDFFNSSLG